MSRQNLTLGEVADIVMGQSPPGHTCNTSGIGLPLLNGPTEFGPHHPFPSQYTTEPRKRAYPGDILFCVRGSTTGRMNWADREYAIGRGIAAIRHKRYPELQPFVRAVIENALPKLLAQATGSTFPNVSYGLLATIPWPPLSLPEQRAIAHILGTLDDKIELLRRMNETLEAMARALFKSWFVDFDPVIDNALEAGNPIPDELKEKAKRRLALGERRKPLPEHLRRLFPDRFVDSELGPIPEGWRVTTIGGIAKVASGKRPGQRFLEPREDAKVPLYGGNGPMAYVREPLYEQPILLTGRVGTLGSVFRITSPCWPSDNTLVLLARKPECYEFLYFQLNLLDLQVLNRGSTQPLLTQSDLKAQPIIKPPDGLLVRFHVIAAVLLEKVDTNQKLDRALTAIRDALLPKLISGEIRVSDAEQFLAEVNI